MADLHSSRSRWRAAFFGLLALWLVTVEVLGYSILDQGVTITYMGEGSRFLRQDLGVAVGLLPALRPEDRRVDVLATLRRQHPAALISATDSTVEIGQLTFRFGVDGRLIAVTHPDLAEMSSAPGQ